MNDKSEYDCLSCKTPLSFMGIWALPPKPGVIGGIGWKPIEPVAYHECEKCGLKMEERSDDVDARYYGRGR